MSNVPPLRLIPNKEAFVVKKRFQIAAWLLGLIVLSGCDPEVRTQSQIHLPEGDAERGKTTFVELGCVNCHSVVGAELPEGEGPVRVVLGSSGRVKTYGDLVTSVVNPSHKLSRRYRPEAVSADGESLMVTFNDVMTVTQLTDLVAFLGEHYQRLDRPRYQYRRYDAEAGSGAERKRSGMNEE